MNATLYKKKGDVVQCTACSQRCTIHPGKTGICAVRQNTAGALHLLVYGKAVGLNVDPIEKKPLYHFLPGTTALSFGTVGCNFRCSFCQNWDMSQASKEGAYYGTDAPPETIVRLARTTNCASIAYTYNEPAIFIEYAHDTAKLAHEHGIKNVFVSNGYETAEAFAFIEPYLDAINVDLKSFRDAFYRTHCGARLKPVLDTIKRVAKSKVWLEVTTLIIPGENDSDEELTQIAQFVANLNPEIPWHISRFFPHYKLHKPSTPLTTLERAYRIGKEAGLEYIYVGNAPAENNTQCPHCNATLITRTTQHLFSSHASSVTSTIEKGRCPQCKHVIPGIWT
ncbi:AmmeMemoRadiSam system radical SAM enzyme [Candidatus Woesearchaeota archaeon]|nr:MAG: AmmeMemoRadiSam system radical SAM enzyme [Candidatus Woesearchaeota archaeon]